MMRNHQRKGQSAIEYLTTYGWALLAIIIVGAVLVNMGVFSQCQTTTPRFSGQNVAVDSWSWTGTTSMSMTFQAIQRDITVTNVSFDWDQDGTYDQTIDVNSPTGVSVSAGSTNSTSVTGLSTTSGECARANVRVTYDYGSTTGAIATGSGTLGGPVP